VRTAGGDFADEAEPGGVAFGAFAAVVVVVPGEGPPAPPPPPPRSGRGGIFGFSLSVTELSD